MAPMNRPCTTHQASGLPLNSFGKPALSPSYRHFSRKNHPTHKRSRQGHGRGTVGLRTTGGEVLQIISTSVQQFQGGAEGLGTFLNTAPPSCYLIYLLAAGFGLPCSEDALVAWVGTNAANGMYGNWSTFLPVLGILYVGVVLSDLITFGIGILLRMGFLKPLKKSLLRESASTDRAMAMVRKWSRYTGVPPEHFVGGVAVGALGTMPIQLFVGYLLRNTPNPYFAALAIAAGPNVVGHVVGPLATAGAFWWAGRGPKDDTRSKGGTSQGLA